MRFFRIVSRLSIAGVLVFFFATTASAVIYTDVPQNSLHAPAIAALSDQGVVSGYGNGEFHPEGLINRAEAIKILIRSEVNADTLARALDWHRDLNHHYAIFQDIGINEWFAPYLEIAYQNHIIQGYPDGLFRPAAFVNFAEALKMILESRHVNLSSSVFTANPFLYVEKADWFEPYFSYADQKNLISHGKFYHPAQLITRGEFTEILYRLDIVLAQDLMEFVPTASGSSEEYTITLPTLGIINQKVYFADIYNTQNALSVLREGLGHYLAAPGSNKKTVIFGHSSGYHWDNSPYKTIFRQINNLKNGDRIYINYHEKGYIYEVFKSEILPATRDAEIISNSNADELALYTCWPPGTIKSRYVIYSKPVL